MLTISQQLHILLQRLLNTRQCLLFSMSSNLLQLSWRLQPMWTPMF